MCRNCPALSLNLEIQGHNPAQTPFSVALGADLSLLIIKSNKDIGLNYKLEMLCACVIIVNEYV